MATEFEIQIDVNYQPEHEAPGFSDEGDRPMLTWWRHPMHGDGWTLWYLDDPSSRTAGVEEYFIGGDLLEVDEAVATARRHIEMVRATDWDVEE